MSGYKLSKSTHERILKNADALDTGRIWHVMKRK